VEKSKNRRKAVQSSEASRSLLGYSISWSTVGEDVVQRLSVAEAAKVLGVSEQAIYARVKRDTIQHELGENGGITIILPDEEATNHKASQPVDQLFVNGYITSLKSEIESLKQDREVWQEEARRKDTIIAQMNQTMGALINRMPELEASPDATESPTTAGNGENKGSVSPDAENRSWWRRIFTP
jgi:hypothetical protein